jgi:autotransporter-associated beta strand protein
MKSRVYAPCTAAALLAFHFILPAPMHAQTTTVWDGGPTGGGTSWLTAENWAGDAQPPNASNSNVLIDNRNNPGTIGTLTISASRTLGLVTFDNINNVLASTLNVDTNGSGSTARTLTLHTGVTLQNTGTTVAFRGNNGALSVVLGADNTFTTSAGSYLQFNSGVVVSGGFGVAMAGLGTVGLNAPNTFTGGVTVQNGSTLRIGAATQSSSASSTVSGGVLASGQAGTGTLAMQNGAALVSGGSGQRTLQNNLTLAGAVTFGAASTYTGALVFNSSSGSGTGETLDTPATITLLADTTVTTNVTTSFFNVMSGAAALTKQGPGILRISATNTYGGGTTVASGTLEFGRTGSLGTGTVTLGSAGGGDASLLNYLGGWTLANDIIVAGGSGGTLTLGYTSTADFSGNFSGGIMLNDALTLRSDAADGFAMRLTGGITGVHDVTKSGSGMVRIENNNAGFSGRTIISAGTLQLGSLNGSTTGAAGSGEIVNNAALRINRSNAFSLTNLISGTGIVTQAGSGSTTLGNSNTYSGGTTVSAGALIVTNTSGSATGTGGLVTAAGTTLGGTGAIAPTGGNSVILGGSVAPGVSGSAGTLTFTPVDGNVTFQNTSSIVFELFGNGSNDKINLAATGTGTLDFSAMAPGSISVVFSGGYTPGAGHGFDLLDWSGVTGLSTSLLNLSTAGFDPSWVWDTSLFTTNGTIAITVIPEPKRAVLLAAGLGWLMSRRHRPGACRAAGSRTSPPCGRR